MVDDVLFVMWRELDVIDNAPRHDPSTFSNRDALEVIATQ